MKNEDEAAQKSPPLSSKTLQSQKQSLSAALPTSMAASTQTANSRLNFLKGKTSLLAEVPSDPHHCHSIHHGQKSPRSISRLQPTLDDDPARYREEEGRTALLLEMPIFNLPPIHHSCHQSSFWMEMKHQAHQIRPMESSVLLQDGTTARKQKATSTSTTTIYRRRSQPPNPLSRRPPELPEREKDRGGGDVLESTLKSLVEETRKSWLASGPRGKSDDQTGSAETHGNDAGTTGEATAENSEPLVDDANASFDLFKDAEDLPDEYNYDYDDYVDESMWGDEDWTEHEHEKAEDYVSIDAHILSTPVIADIDSDGVQEMIIAVSYFFDREYYDNPEHIKELGGIDIGKYIASGIVVFNLDTKQVKWTADLDLSTENGNFRAHAYSSPTVVDLDGDGNLDILVGTSYGLFYVIDHRGKIRKNFPLEMAEIHAPVIAADINDDGKIEMVTADVHGNVAAWTAEGEEIWEVHLKSLVPQRPTVGDVNGDGHTDVVVPTVSGNIYVLSGKDGSKIQPFPYRAHGRIMSPVLLLDMSKHGEKTQGLTLATTSFDGYLYLIEGSSGCADVVDIGETSYTMVLADNVDGGDDLDLIVTTMNGNVFCFSTQSPHHPLKEWRSSNQGRNNAAYRYNRQGVYVKHGSRTFRDEEGKHFWVEFEIVDKYRVPYGNQAPYNVTVTLLVPGNYQGDRHITVSQVYNEPGHKRMQLPTVPVRTTGTVLVEMVDKHGLHFSDEYSLTFHMHYFKLLKWLVVLPMLGMFCVLVILRPQEGAPLPSFSRNID